MTLIARMPTDSTSGFESDQTRAALGFIHKLLQGSGDWSPLELLAEVANVFAARAAGLAAPLSGSPIVQYRTDLNGTSDLPWEKDPAILSKVRAATSAISVRGEASWLLTAALVAENDPGLLWLEAAAERDWTAGEQAAFALAGQALGRVASLRADAVRAAERAALRRRMEETASVAGRLAHDFGNVLTGILGFAELSLAQTPPESPSRQYLNEVLASARHGAGWVRKLQMLGRRQRTADGSSLLQEILTEEASRCRQAWGGNIIVLLTPADALPAVAVDRAGVREILRQLLDNAREAIADRGVVTIAARAAELDDCLELIGNARPGPHVEVTITDSGSGFSAETRRRLFADVFFSTKNRQRGLGLALVYAHLCACHGGLRISPAPEQGTAVRVYLPVRTTALIPENIVIPERQGERP